MTLEGELQTELNAARQIRGRIRQRVLYVRQGMWRNAVQPLVRSVEQIGQSVGSGQSKTIVKLVGNLVEVDAVKNVGAFRDQIESYAPVAVDIHGLCESEIGGCVVCTTVPITRCPKRHGVVRVQRDAVDQARCPERERQAAADGHNRGQGHIGKDAAQ